MEREEAKVKMTESVTVSRNNSCPRCASESFSVHQGALTCLNCLNEGIRTRYLPRWVAKEKRTMHFRKNVTEKFEREKEA